MPYKSQAQEKYFNANRAKLEGEGVDVDEWNQASKGMKLKKRVKRPNPTKPKLKYSEYQSVSHSKFHKL